MSQPWSLRLSHGADVGPSGALDRIAAHITSGMASRLATNTACNTSSCASLTAAPPGGM